MKKWGFLLLLIVCLSLAFVIITPISHDKIEIQSYNSSDDQEDSDNIQQKEITNEQIYQGNLLLVNHEYPVHHESIKSDIIDLSEYNELTQGYVLLGNENNLSEDLAHKFMEMIAEAGEDGPNHFAITSGFRSFEEQNILYEQMGSDRALPAGNSEHNLGLSLDVGSTQKKMEKSPEGKWIEQNAWKYGFILRYPEEKMDITKIQYEPWHIRYVGLPHSAIMHDKKMVLEEYLDYLKESDISVNINGEKYIISYYPFTQGLTIEVPKNHDYKLSGNNMDGVIMTVYE